LAASPSRAFFTVAGAPARNDARRDRRILPDDAAGRNQRAFADRASVEQRRIASDQGVAFDRAIFHHRAVTDRHIVADESAAPFADVDDRII